MKPHPGFALALASLLLFSGCATYNRHPLDSARAAEVEKTLISRRLTLTPEIEDQILALDPEHLTATQIHDVLGQAPAPRIINIHGGIFPVHTRMISFSRFLVGMGYPDDCIRNPGDGTYTFSCYESSDKVAGFIAWYFEKEALRPIIVGHSQGGFQAVKVLRKFAGKSGPNVAVYNPLTWKKEDRCEITDPLTGKTRPVVGLQLPYVTGVGTGGLTRVLPNQYDTIGCLRDIPDSVEDFTGFYKHWDSLGGDWLGFGSANLYHPTGSANVRTIRLPGAYSHGTIPNTAHLVKNQEIIDRINAYVPTPGTYIVADASADTSDDTLHILWAQEVWHGIRKHWVLELQQLIRAQRAAGKSNVAGHG